MIGGRVSKLYAPVLVVHVLAAVLGLGSIASVGIVAATARRTQRAAMGASMPLLPLLRYSALSLATMLATGVLLDLTAAGAFSAHWWFRGSRSEERRVGKEWRCWRAASQ